VFTVGSRSVAAAILAAVEGGILPPGSRRQIASAFPGPYAISAGQDARLYGRQDACRYGKQVRREAPAAGGRATSDHLKIGSSSVSQCEGDDPL